MEKFFKIIVIVCFLVGCKQNPKTGNVVDNITSNTVNNMQQYSNSTTGDSISNLLSRQLQAGEGVSGDFGSYVNYAINKNDYEITENVIAQIIKTKGYNKPALREFQVKVKSIFGVDAEKVFHIYMDYPSYNCICENIPVGIYEVEEGMRNYIIHIDTLHCIITQTYFLPELIDYQKSYPDIAKIEDGMTPKIVLDGEDAVLTRWKDIPDLSQDRKLNIDMLFHRNKYLFNGSEASLTWLITNDKYFLEQLVRIFGYDKEAKINKYILDSICKQYNSIQSSREILLKNLFAAKDCNGKLQIREGLLKYISENYDKQYETPIDMLNFYAIIMSLLESKNYPDITNDFTPQERLKIAAYAGYYDQLARYKNNVDNPNDPESSYSGSADWNDGSFLRNTLGSNQKLLEEIKKNNYYGLPNFQRIIEDLLSQIEEDSARWTRMHSLQIN